MLDLERIGTPGALLLDVLGAHGAGLRVRGLVFEQVFLEHVLRHSDELLSSLLRPLLNVLHVCDLLVDLTLLLVLLLSLPVLLALTPGFFDLYISKALGKLTLSFIVCFLILVYSLTSFS